MPWRFQPSRIGSHSVQCVVRRPPSRLPLLLLRLQQFFAFLEYCIDRLRRAGVEAQSAAFEATGRIEFVGRRGEPCAGRADGNANGLMGATVRMADQVIANNQHGFHSFEETLGEDLEHVFLWETAHFHSLTRSLSRSFNSGICSILLRIAPRIFSRRAVRCASLSFFSS